MFWSSFPLFLVPCYAGTFCYSQKDYLCFQSFTFGYQGCMNQGGSYAIYDYGLIMSSSSISLCVSYYCLKYILPVYSHEDQAPIMIFVRVNADNLFEQEGLDQVTSRVAFQSTPFCDSVASASALIAWFLPNWWNSRMNYSPWMWPIRPC